MALWIVLSIFAIAFGALQAFAGGMASAPTPESERFSRNGCLIFFGGLISLAIALGKLVLS